jgi:hypothetical protein
MARQVFFDPFGQYTEGFDRGAGRQIQTEGAARQARAQDYDFNTMAPYRLAAVQREDQLGKTTLPYQEALAPYALDTARANRYDTLSKQAGDFAQMFNTPAPLQQLAYQYFGITPANTSVGPHGEQNTQLFMNDPSGNPVAVSQQPNIGQHVLDYLNWARNLQSRQLLNQQQYQQGVLQNTSNRNDAYQTTAQARMYGALGHYYQGAGGINAGSLFGGNMPNDLMSSGYYQNPQQQAPQQGLDEYNLGPQ